MAATAHNRNHARRQAALRPLALFLLLVPAAGTLSAQRSKAIYEQVGYVASALTAGNAADAMTPFDKSLEGYDRLRDYFSALAAAYQVVNQIQIMDEDINREEATLTVHWELTLSDAGNGLSQTREDNITVKLSLRKYKWRITGFSPLEFFNPQLTKSK
jgi:hypothetical protein